MKNLIYFFFFALLLAPHAKALGAVAEIQFTMYAGEELCNELTLYDDTFQGALTAKDLWAEKNFMERDLEAHTLSADEAGVTIKYLNVIDDFVNNVTTEVCVSAEEAGDYHGLLIYRAYNEGDTTAANLGTWIVVHTTERPPEPAPSGGGGGGGGKGTARLVVAANKTNSTNLSKSTDGSFEYLAEQNSQQETQPSGIEGETQQGNEEEPKLFRAWQIIPVLFIVAVAAASIMVRKKRREVTFNQQKFSV
jgi:hypothetical protein